MSQETRLENAWTGNPERMRQFLDDVTDYAILLLDTDGQVQSWNHGAERLFGYSAAEIIGRHISCAFIPEDVRSGKPGAELRHADERGQFVSESWHVRKDGTRFWGNQVCTALRDECGSLQGFAKVMRDITGRKHLEMELQRQAEELSDANRRKDDFLAMLSHELRNPLAPILNSVHILRNSPNDPSAVQFAGIMIERQVNHLGRLIADLLEVTRLSRGQVPLRPEAIELGAAVSKAAESIRPVMANRRHELVVTPPDAPLWLEADAVRLDQILVNLLDNAAKYTDDGGHIEVSAELDGRDALIRVRDNGMGIASDLLPRVFDLFEQADKTLDRSRGGIGIGLTLVKNLVARHGGTIEARSEGEGKGSEFLVRLPARPTLPAAAKPAPTEPRPAGTLRILVVDDNVDTAMSLARLLRYLGHRVETAHSGAAAIEVLRGDPFDAVLLDIGLPQIDGFTVARRIRATATIRQPLLVAITGYGFDTDKERAKEAGFDHYLVKPVDPSSLESLLAQRSPLEPATEVS